ncbi:hypothetical protein CspeluHIS016_0307970 [Cutaneotrichosporon spelunceum]|uniref:Uncharacterized protein n=1 Tax=Cutaneotrichosporon spelunceum TaxID=1672016 RepID=A0AAD3TU64_9TREE|nr:hypothetical protein CspeluHIS016_0307970 [Cutaneotrichosporon spelunceum]
MGKLAPREADLRAMDLLRAIHREVLTREPLRILQGAGLDLRLQTILDAAASGDENVTAAWEAFVNRIAADRGRTALPRRATASDTLLEPSASSTRVAARVVARDRARAAARWVPLAESYWNASGERLQRAELANEREATPAPVFVYDEPPEHLQPDTATDQQEDDDMRTFRVSGSTSASESVSAPRAVASGLTRRRRLSVSPPLSEESMSWLREYGTQRRQRDESPPLRRVRRRINDGRRFGIVFDASGMPVTGGATPDEGSGREGDEVSGSGNVVGEQAEIENANVSTGAGAVEEAVAVTDDADGPLPDLPFTLMTPHDMFTGLEAFGHEEV